MSTRDNALFKKSVWIITDVFWAAQVLATKKFFAWKRL